MFWRWVLATAAIGVLSIATGSIGYTQGIVTGLGDIYKCSYWQPIQTDKAGTRRRLNVFTFPDGRPRGFYNDKTGVFDFASSDWIAFVTDATDVETAQFILPANRKTVRFVHDEPKGAEIWVRDGYLVDLHAKHADGILKRAYSFECVKGASHEALEEIRPGGSIAEGDRVTAGPVMARPADRPPAPIPEPSPSLADRFSPGIKEKFSLPAEPLSDGKLANILPKESPAAPPAGASVEDTGSLSAMMKSKHAAASARDPEPASSVSVCRIGAADRLQIKSGLKLTSVQAVGKRNMASEIDGFEYDGVTPDVHKIGKAIVADSAGRLLPYNPVRPVRLNASAPLLVEFDGIGLAPRSPAAEPPRPAGPVESLKIVVVGGAAELSMSGLALVDHELKSQSSGRARPVVEWHSVSENGDVTAVGKFPSFGDLAAEVEKRAAGGRPDALTETQLDKLLDDFERMLKDRANPVSKVLWFKGAYSIPASFPKRFDSFLEKVSASGKVARSPNKWFLVVTARMPGFSIAYLREPIARLDVGEVIEEVTAAGGSPRLIGDAGAFATKLRAGLSASADAPSDPEPAPLTLAGKLVVDAGQAFDERGYVISADAARTLSQYLQRVQNEWRGKDTRPEIGGKPNPTALDLLQADGKIAPRLLVAGQAFLLKPIRSLDPAEADKVKDFIRDYRVGAQGVAEAAARLAASGCEFLFVPEVTFFPTTAPR